MKRKIFGAVCILFAVIFAHLETKHFGNNFFPNTKEEIMCDLMTLFLAISGHIIYWSKFETKS